MKKFIFLLSAVLIMAACSQETIKTEVEEEHGISLRGGEKVDICHTTGDGTWHVIQVSVNAVKAHVDHGDVVLIDADGDGWVEAENMCVPGGDCDDNNADVNPGAVEKCDNAIDDNCDGVINEGCCPYWTVDEILAGGYSLWFDYRTQGCITNEVGFAGPPCNFGYADGNFFRDINCNDHPWDPALAAPCDDVLLAAQAILNLALWCGPPSPGAPGGAGAGPLD